jgi:TPP-dependent pyruvate/acetoin dehydrogenase alpha subunit
MTIEPELLAYYREMLLIRRVEETLSPLVSTGEITGSIHLCIGQEAIPVGACRALGPDDPVIATYRGHGWAMARGVPPEQLVAEILGRDSELNGGRGGSAYLSGTQYGFYGENSIVGAGAPLAMGLSMAAKYKGQDRVALCAMGDGAPNQGVVHETLNMASVLKIPMILVIENNGYVEMTPSADLTAVNAAERAVAYSAPSWDIDGNDPAAVAKTIAEARTVALSSQTPVIVEARTRRLSGHYSGDAQHYRPVGELERWREDEPLRRIEMNHNAGSELAQIAAQVESEVDSAFAAARRLPVPDETTVMRNMYADR